MEAAKASSDVAEGLHTEVDIAISARIMLTRNLWVEKGLVNGAMGTVRDISWKEGKDPSKDLPEAIMVQFDNYHGPFFAEDADGSGFVPIFPSTTRFELNGVDCTRTQFPLRVAYAITVHKAQGLTIASNRVKYHWEGLRLGFVLRGYLTGQDVRRATV